MPRFKEDAFVKVSQQHTPHLQLVLPSAQGYQVAPHHERLAASISTHKGLHVFAASLVRGTLSARLLRRLETALGLSTAQVFLFHLNSLLYLFTST